MTTIPTTPLVVEVRDLVATVWLNRPDARNAIDLALATALVETFADLADSDVRAVVITGRGSAFCAGLDLRSLDGSQQLADLPRFVDAIATSPLVRIAAVNGPAVTAGLEIALACDLIVASTSASFADTHLRVGVFPGPVLVDLPRRIGLSRASEMIMSGNFIDARRAEAMGLVNRVVEPEELVDSAIDLAAAIAEQDPSLLAAVRAALHETAGLVIAEARHRHGELARAAMNEPPTGQSISRHRDRVIELARQRSHTPLGPDQR